MTIDFPWQSLEVVFDGLSIIDVPRLDLRSEAEAYQFLNTYGYDLFEPSHLEQVWKIYADACDFLENKVGVEIPDILKQREALGDFRSVLLAAAGHEGHSLGKYHAYLCAILRVMHVISHVRNDLRLKYISKVRKQTIGRFEAHIHRVDTKGQSQTYLGYESQRIPLVKFEKKEGKDRHSVLMKLLQKRETVAQEIYDHLGVRFVTRTRGEAILVMKYLLDHHLIAVANVIGARSRNTLIELKSFRHEVFGKNPESIDYDELEKKLSHPDSPFGVDNPFSSPDYHSLQFTCRPLIRIPVVRKGGIKAEVAFFFPIEIQIMDESSYVKSLEGHAKHSVYKQRQLEAVRKRILRNLDFMRTKVGFVSLGCPKNLVDTERMMDLLSKDGAVLTGDQNAADIVVINTCGFLDPAKKESMDTIGEFTALKKKKKIKGVVVTGCMTERYLGLMRETYPLVDAFLQTKEFSRIVEVVREISTGDEAALKARKELQGEDELSGFSEMTNL